jgi:hypothetical protein
VFEQYLTPENATVAGLAAAALYAFWRRIKQDGAVDRSTRAEDVFRDDLIDLNKALNARCDRFAHERNEAMAEVADLRAREAMLQAQLNRARQACPTPRTCGIAGS